jgi:hypothetical protein
MHGQVEKTMKAKQFERTSVRRVDWKEGAEK